MWTKVCDVWFLGFPPISWVKYWSNYLFFHRNIISLFLVIIILIIIFNYTCFSFLPWLSEYELKCDLIGHLETEFPSIKTFVCGRTTVAFTYPHKPGAESRSVAQRLYIFNGVFGLFYDYKTLKKILKNAEKGAKLANGQFSLAQLLKKTRL